MTTDEEIERIFRMSDEELRWELRADGVTARFRARKAAGE